MFVNGRKILTFGEGALTRASGAYHPETGEAYPVNKPRLAASRLPLLNWRPKVYFTFDPSETQMQYNAAQDPDNNLEDRQTEFEASHPAFTRIVLGTSTQARDIVAYRLGPVSRKHFVVIGGVNGDEIDGINGLFQAMEELHDEAEFADFRAEWSIFFVPTLNPDGWFLDTANTAQVGPNSQTVNLNRNFDWFWDEYAELATESKGATPESTPEAAALLTYFRTGDGGGAVPFGFLMDFQANDGVGSRYQARERNYRATASAPGTPLPIPGGHLETQIDFYIFRLAQALTNVRAREQSGPDHLCRPLRTRFLPRLHQYFASQGVPSMEVSEVKVSASNGQETYASAANFRLDYVMAAAAAVTAAKWTFEDAAVIEQSGVNLLSANPEWDQWSAGDQAPSSFTVERGSLTRQQQAPEVIDTPERFLGDGEAALLTTDTDIALPAAAEYVRAAELSRTLWCALDPTSADVLRFGLEDFRGFENVHAITHATLVGVGAAGGLPDALELFGGGTAAPDTGMTNAVSRISTVSGTPAEASVGTMTIARMFHSVVSNLLSNPGSPNERVFIFGGFSSAGTRAASVEIWNPNTNSSAAATATFPVGYAQMAAAYHPTLNRIYLAGGTAQTTGTGVTQLWEYNIGADTLTEMSTIDASLVLPTALRNMTAVYNPTNRTIMLMGGETDAGSFSSAVYELDPVNQTFRTLSLQQNLADDEAKEGTAVPAWATALGRSAAVSLGDDTAQDGGRIYVLGGRLTNGAGALQDSIYLVDTEAVGATDGVIGLAGEIDHAYIRSTQVILDSATATVDTDDFTDVSLADWTDPVPGIWTSDGLVLTAGGAGTSHLVRTVPPAFADQTVRMTLEKTGSSEILPVHFIFRASFALPNITDGYRVVYDDSEAAEEWRLERVNATVVTVLATLDVSADPTRRVTTSTRSFEASVIGKDPVIINVTFNSLAIFTDFVDITESRIVAPGQVALFGGSS